MFVLSSRDNTLFLASIPVVPSAGALGLSFIVVFEADCSVGRSARSFESFRPFMWFLRSGFARGRVGWTLVHTGRAPFDPCI